MSLFAGSGAGPAFIPSVAAFGASLQHDWEFDEASAPFSDSVNGADFSLNSSGSVTTGVTNSVGETGIEIPGDNSSGLQASGGWPSTVTEFRIELLGFQLPTISDNRFFMIGFNTFGTFFTGSYRPEIADSNGNTNSLLYNSNLPNTTGGSAVDFRVTAKTDGEGYMESKPPSASTWDELDRTQVIQNGNVYDFGSPFLPANLGSGEKRFYERVKLYYTT